MADQNSTSSSANTRSEREMVALNIRRLRTERGWSQEKLAQKAQIDRTHLARFETRAINISLDVMFRLAAALEIDAQRLLIPPRDWPDVGDDESVE